MRPQHLKFMNETHFRFPADGDRPFGAGAQTGHGCAAHRGATTRRRQTVSGMGSVSKQLRCSGLLGDLVWTLSTRSGQNAGLEKEFAGQPVRFLTVASDEMDRVKKYFADKGLTLQTYVEGESAGTFDSFGIHGVPAAAIIGREGRIIGVTPGENVTAVVRKLLNGEQVELPPFQRLNNITWDQKEMTWQDGVQPEFAVLIKPIEVTGGGYLYKPGSNRISGDGAMVQAMMQAAWQTDSKHVDLRDKLPEGTYRFAAMVPKGREAELLPALQDVLQAEFRLPGALGGTGERRAGRAGRNRRAACWPRWEEQESGVLAGIEPRRDLHSEGVGCRTPFPVHAGQDHHEEAVHGKAGGGFTQPAGESGGG